MPDGYILDENGNPVAVDIMTCARWNNDTANRRVAEDEISDDVTVSTVFLGLDHSFGSGGPPVLWETMVFGGPLDGEQEREDMIDIFLRGHNVPGKTRAAKVRWLMKHAYK